MHTALCVICSGVLRHCRAICINLTTAITIATATATAIATTAVAIYTSECGQKSVVIMVIAVCQKQQLLLACMIVY
jgi:hypothetical protein